MNKRIFSLGLLAVAALAATVSAQAAPDELRVMVHSSFSLPKPLPLLLLLLLPWEIYPAARPSHRPCPQTPYMRRQDECE